MEPVSSYIHKEERQHTGVDMYRNVGLRVTRKWPVYLALADLSDLLCHTGRRRISYSLKLRHLILDNISANRVYSHFVNLRQLMQLTLK